PEAGGQPCDKGYLGGIEVRGVQIENGEIYHYTKSPLGVGDSVNGEIDFARRFNFMQNHTAEHIVSGIVYKKYGFDNIGFHLNESEVTFDFNGFFSAKDLSEIEAEANKRVWQNLSVKAYYPTNDELKSISYRYKSSIEGKIRLVEIENTDICACCAPHVKSTGEIGIIKFLGTEKQHGGTRIFMKCGSFALNDYSQKTADIDAVCKLLSAKPQTLKNTVFDLWGRYEQEKQTLKNTKEQLFSYMIKHFGISKKAIILKNADIKDLQFLADGLHKTHGGVRVAITENGNGTAFVMCGGSPDIENEFQKLKLVFTVKGGGRDKIRQGSIVAPVGKVSDYFGI
ncbi:MAG: alanyl-tRNA editing protein, partial [Clostridia bacterium]|nr:alanyl-tRNA editing protein [Clostridia bacterium]